MKLIDQMIRDFPDSSKRTLLQWIRHRRVVVDGVPCLHPHALVEGYTLEDKAYEVGALKLLYRDKYIIVIDKPEGLLSVPAEDGAPSALTLLARHFRTKNLYAVHRIDQDTSGVLLFVWGVEARMRFDALFAEHRIEREYVAIVDGRLAQDAGEWRYPLRELEDYSVVVDPEGGRESCTHFTVVKRGGATSCLLLKLHTGRKHQIRVHCREAGHPVIGDRRYGRRSSRLFLHARLLTFEHPFTGKMMHFESPLPRAFIHRGFPPSLSTHSS